jgi:hypothetical protein
MFRDKQRKCPHSVRIAKKLSNPRPPAQPAPKIERRLASVLGLAGREARVEGQRQIAAADLGPVRYLAALLGAGDQDVLRWFICIVDR